MRHKRRIYYARSLGDKETISFIADFFYINRVQNVACPITVSRFAGYNNYVVVIVTIILINNIIIDTTYNSIIIALSSFDKRVVFQIVAE